MDVEEYRRRGKELVDYIADYLRDIRKRRVFPDVTPGYMRELIPETAPLEGEPWEAIFADVERVIMPGVTHWQSPYMHAYFPALNSFPSLLGDMLADAINCLGFTWASSPACTELETIVMVWLGRMIGLPEEFLHSRRDSPGGGVIQTTASEATFVSLLAARTEAIRRCKAQCPASDVEDAEINSRLVAYCSDQAHSSVEKAGLIGLVKMRYIESDERLSLRGDKLVEAIQKDRQNGLIPFFLCATLGTTGACSFDNLQELGPICKREDIWIHVDAAYAGTAFVCPEFRLWLSGIEYAHSLAFNPSKWMMVHFDCTAMCFSMFPTLVPRFLQNRMRPTLPQQSHTIFVPSVVQQLCNSGDVIYGEIRRCIVGVKNSGALHRTFNVEPLYLQHENSGLAIDYMHWQIPLSKRFRALKLWFVIRSYGIKGLQKHVREGVRLAKKFEELVRADERFEVPAERHLGMVVFRLKGENELTEKLLKKLNSSGKLHCVPASLKGKYVIRFTVTSTRTKDADIERDWAVIRSTALDVLQRYYGAGGLGERRGPCERPRKNVADIKKQHPDFGTSLLLANSPMSPKIVNGSFVAIFDQRDLIVEFARKFGGLRVDVMRDSPAMRRRIRGMVASGKQYSLDSRMDLVQTIVSSAAVTLPVQREMSIEDATASAAVEEQATIIAEVEKCDQSSLPENGSSSRIRSRSVGDDPPPDGAPTTTTSTNGDVEVNEGLCHKCRHTIAASEVK